VVWLLDEGTGDVVKDSSDNHIDGTLMNLPKWVKGRFGSALEFDGTSNYVSAPDEALPVEKRTLVAYVKQTGVPKIWLSLFSTPL